MSSSYLKPIRFVPFDIGTPLNLDLVNYLKNSLSKDYNRIKLSRIKEAILSENVFAFQVSEKIECYFYLNGMACFVIKCPKYEVSNDSSFAVDYLIKRRYYHNALAHSLEIDHAEYQELYQRDLKIVDQFVNVIRTMILAFQPATLHSIQSVESRRKKGFSYSYSMCCLENEEFEHFDTMDEETKSVWMKNISCIINPSLIGQEDASIVQNTGLNREEAKQKFSSLKGKFSLSGIDVRKEVNAYVSYFSLVICAASCEKYLEEYIAFEIQLHTNWAFLYMASKYLNDQTLLLNKNKDLIEAKRKLYEGEKIDLDNIIMIRQVNPPKYLKDIRQTIISTSEIEELLKRYLKKSNFYIDIIQTNIINSNRRYNTTSEILLLFISVISFMNVVNLMAIYGLKPLTIIVSLVPVLLFFVLSFRIYKKNKMN